ncbi:NUDIX hydrolase [candidate division KSB1 bacterium]|nr:NUDIX hydrolase [candidate division KSB1 bacterium]
MSGTKLYQKKQEPAREIDRNGRERPDFPRLGVGVLALKDDQFILIKRGNPPGRGKWTLPGGLVQVGETIKQAAERELLEECNVTVRLRDEFHLFEYIHREAETVLYHYIILDYIADYHSGRLTAGSDVEAAAWFRLADLKTLHTTDHLCDFINRVLLGD